MDKKGKKKLTLFADLHLKYNEILNAFTFSGLQQEGNKLTIYFHTEASTCDEVSQVDKCVYIRLGNQFTHGFLV